MSAWISVEVDVPKDGEDILFNVPSCYGVEKGRRFARKWISDRTSPYNDEVYWDTDQVTHWMLLPECTEDAK